MPVTELSALHTTCEVERTQLLSILAMSVKNQNLLVFTQLKFVVITCPSQREPQITDDFFICLEHLKASLLYNSTTVIHFPIAPTSIPQLFCVMASLSPMLELYTFMALLSFIILSFCSFAI